MTPALDSLSTEIILLIVENLDSLTILLHLRATCRYFRYLPISHTHCMAFASTEIAEQAYINSQLVLGEQTKRTTTKRSNEAGIGDVAVRESGEEGGCRKRKRVGRGEGRTGRGRRCKEEERGGWCWRAGYRCSCLSQLQGREHLQSDMSSSTTEDEDCGDLICRTKVTT